MGSVSHEACERFNVQWSWELKRHLQVKRLESEGYIKHFHDGLMYEILIPIEDTL